MSGRGCGRRGRVHLTPPTGRRQYCPDNGFLPWCPTDANRSVHGADHNILNRCLLLYPSIGNPQESPFGGYNANQTGVTTNGKSERFLTLPGDRRRQSAKDICHSPIESRCCNYRCSASTGACFCQDNREGICCVCKE